MKSLHFLLTVVLSAFFAISYAQEPENIVEGEDGLPDLSISDEVKSQAKAQDFQAEVSRLMEIIIHSLYTDRDIFLRELISNAADALDKVRYQSLTDKSVLGETKDLEIKVKADKESNTITIIDSGIGMTDDELAKNLGTVAHSGTAAFLDKFAKATAEGENPLQLIGQFGVGFYSAFLVADEVTVISKSNAGDQFMWNSRADGKFSVTKDPRGNTLGRGTAIVLKLKEDAATYIDENELERIIVRYSQFMQYPIKLWSSRTETEEVPVEDEEDKEKEKKEGDDEELESTDDDEEKPKTKTITKTINYWKQLNTNKPIWSRAPKDITADEYNEFYKSFSKEDDDPLTYTHFRAEGEIEFNSILYVPKRAPPQMYDNYYTQKSTLRLYVRRVLVADKFEDIVPRYLSFIKGLVDSNDLPLNVNREQLQKNKVMKVISRKLTRKALDMLRALAKKDDEDEDDEAADKEEKEGEDAEKKDEKKESQYSEFWKEFGKSIKLGIMEDTKSRKKLMELLRFPSSKSKGSFISLQTYTDRMKDGQKNIFFASGQSAEEIESLPVMQKFLKDDLEVLYYTDNLDEYLNLDEYDDFKFQAIGKEGVELGGKKFAKFMSDKEEEFEDLKKWYKELLGSDVTKVQLSKTLDTAPVGVLAGKYGYSARMDKIARAQAFGNSNSYMSAQKILELNYRHPVVKELKKRVADAPEDEQTKAYAKLLYDMALVQSGYEIADGKAFAERVSSIVSNGFGVADQEVEPEPKFDESEAAEAEGEEDEGDEEDEYDDEVEADGDEKTEL